MKDVNRKIARHAIMAQARIYEAVERAQAIAMLAEIDAVRELMERVQNLGMDLEITLSRIASVVKDHVADTDN